MHINFKYHDIYLVPRYSLEWVLLVLFGAMVN